MQRELRHPVRMILLLAIASCARPASGSQEADQGITPMPIPTDAPIGRIAFSSYRDGLAQIYLINTDGSELKRMTELEMGVTYADWSPDGARIAVVLRVEAWNFDIALLAADGAFLTFVTDSPNVLDIEPDWSPDSTLIAFASDEDRFRDARAGIDVYTTSPDGSHRTRLTDSLAWGLENVVTFLEQRQWSTSPDWHPDGRLLAFRTNRDGNNEIYVMAPDGSGPMNLTNHPASDTDPAWSPDGSQIAFVSDRTGDEEIYVMSADGSNPNRLTQNEGKDTYPVWSPDGERIAYYSEIPGRKNLDIYVMRADGSERSRLTTHPDFDGYPAWEPYP